MHDKQFYLLQTYKPNPGEVTPLGLTGATLDTCRDKLAYWNNLTDLGGYTINFSYVVAQRTGPDMFLDMSGVEHKAVRGVFTHEAWQEFLNSWVDVESENT